MDSQSVITDSQSVITDSQRGPLEGAIFRSLCLVVCIYTYRWHSALDGGPAIYTSHASINRVWIRNNGLWIRNNGLWIRNNGLWIRNNGLWIRNNGLWIQFNSIQHDIYFIHLWTRKGMSEYDKQITITCAHSDENKVIKWKPKIGNTSMYNIKWEYEAVRVS